MEDRNKYIIAFSLIALVVLMMGLFLDLKEDGTSYGQSAYRLILVEKDTGSWYYEIYDTKGLMIRQEFVPGIPGNIDFGTRKSAETTGRLVLTKLLSGELPKVNREELKENGVIN
ncbi:hypothetical protein HME9304_01373 [Flagellimonas maritima]|uniref:DUF4907 domain-containing protein n=1 Tax=Flagellimonas maritima TaxID=1383885 RepID=A0A2Z4LRC1_9FLAO|nr:DUF4907 domain-containing protein [Allomuricauda aurantiaca]AWX44373.1 hypothetical protein HME9304_01373 [Allomuricauda aurantiaca]